ncbi:MAG: T9SS type A sorting domain-containing protein [Lacibacter sp.]
MKKIVSLIITGTLLLQLSFAQGSAGTLDVVSWNLEWFGSASNGPSDKNLQETNAGKILKWLDADLYGLVEIVDTMRLRRVVDFLGANEYGFYISPFCSLATSPSSGNWLPGQKLAFIYRKSIFSNVTARGLLTSSSNAYSNWASGRFPFMLSATVTINSTSKDVNFIVIHGKAGATLSDYTRRLAGAQELKDSFDLRYNTSNTILIGDYNDALNTSIYTSASVSSYNPIIMDSTDADRYNSITLPLGVAGQSSMISFPNVIDNHIISNEMEPYYVPGSAQIKTDVVTIVPDYITAHNTSDHYPVFSKYNLSAGTTAIQEVLRQQLLFKPCTNPFKESVTITAQKSLQDVWMKLMDVNGRIISTYQHKNIFAGTPVQLSVPQLNPGIYFLIIESKQTRNTIKLIHL